jgi:hypothetical protein
LIDKDIEEAIAFITTEAEKNLVVTGPCFPVELGQPAPTRTREAQSQKREGEIARARQILDKLHEIVGAPPPKYEQGEPNGRQEEDAHAEDAEEEGRLR